jgi:hypothetical protein
MSRAYRIEVVDEDLAAVLRQKSIPERIEMVLDANRTARLLVAGRVQTDHPDWNADRVSLEVARRMGRGPG